MPILHSGSDGLEAVWVNAGIGSSNATNQHVDEYGRRQIQENGNNGASMALRLKGMARGQFSIHFVGSYLWGWAGLQLIASDNFNPTNCSYIYAEPAGKPQIVIYTNSSNNLTFATYWDGTTASGNLNSITAINGATLRITRDSSNVIKWLLPSMV